MNNKDCDIEFQKVTTGNGFQNDLIATANNRIELGVIEVCKLNKSVANLKETIVTLDGKNQKLQDRIYWLTVVGVILALIQAIQVLNAVFNWFK